MKLLLNADLTSGLWCRTDSRDQATEQGEFNTLEELAQIIESQAPMELNAAIDGGAVGLMGVEMPIKQARQIIKALPFALEEQLASDVSDNHLIYLGKQSGIAHAAIINLQIIEQIVGIGSLQALVPLSLLMPLKDKAWTLFLNGDLATVRTGEFSGFSCPVNQLSLYLEHAKENTDEEVALNIYSVQVETHQLLVAQLETAGYTVNIDNVADVWALMESFDKRHFANLLTGPFKPVAIKKNKAPSILKPVFALVASIFVLGIMTNVWQGKMNSQLATEVRKASVAYYKTLFPGQRMPKLTRKVKGKFEGGKGSSSTGFSSGLGVIGQTLKTDGQFASIELQNIRFNEKRGGFELDLTASSIAQLESYKSKLSEKGFTVEIRSATNEASKVKGLLKVSQNG